LYDALPVPQTMIDVAKSFASVRPGGAPPFMHWQKYCAESAQFRAAGRDARAMREALRGGARGLRRAVPRRALPRRARRFPTLVPILPDEPAIPDNRRAWEALGQVHAAVPHRVHRQRPGDRRASTCASSRRCPARSGQPHTTIKGAGHFVQEDAGPELAQITLDLIARTSADVLTHRSWRSCRRPTTSTAARGSAIWFLWFQIAVNAFRGWVHVFWADSGAGRIAGIDLSQNGRPVISLLAAVGADQLAMGRDRARRGAALPALDPDRARVRASRSRWWPRGCSGSRSRSASRRPESSARSRACRCVRSRYGSRCASDTPARANALSRESTAISSAVARPRRSWSEIRSSIERAKPDERVAQHAADRRRACRFAPLDRSVNGIARGDCLRGWFSKISAASWSVAFHRLFSGCGPASSMLMNCTFSSIGLAKPS
jgi:haloalkane dehalogenase